MELVFHPWQMNGLYPSTNPDIVEDTTHETIIHYRSADLRSICDKPLLYDSGFSKNYSQPFLFSVQRTGVMFKS